MLSFLTALPISRESTEGIAAMLYFVDLYGELNDAMQELADAHTAGDISKLLRLLALQACCPEAAQAIYGQQEEELPSPPPLSESESLD